MPLSHCHVTKMLTRANGSTTARRKSGGDRRAFELCAEITRRPLKWNSQLLHHAIDSSRCARDEKRGNAAVSEFNKQLLRPKFHQLDIDDLESIRKFCDFLKSTYGGLDVLVNNAAISYKALMLQPIWLSCHQTSTRPRDSLSGMTARLPRGTSSGKGDRCPRLSVCGITL
ncbi:hypothetical protein V5799_009576 [Amblyomma americanum]|uniref:Uncharacterized protein n=1 Tax=Amblyomma americanum TaxID=6943 RepID=A0AAQ4F9Y0_AMBAM